MPEQKPFKLKKNQQDLTYKTFISRPRPQSTHKTFIARQMKQYEATKPWQNKPKPIVCVKPKKILLCGNLAAK